MGSRLGGNGSPPAVLHFLVDTLTSWLAALLSVIPILRGVLPFAKLRAWRASASSCTNELQRRQLPAAAEPEPEQAGSEAGQDSPATREVPPGYNSGVEQQRRTEFKRLQGRVYADYAGAAPYSERLLADVLGDLSTSLHGNPHSEAGWAPESRSAAADAARLATLRWCNADPEHYCCIFTAGATAALKLVGDSFPWGPASAFVHLRDNHTSVLGIRQLAAQHGAACPAAAVEVAAACPAADGELQQAGSSEWCLSPCSKAAAAGLRAAAQAAGAAWRDGSHGEASGSSADEQHHLLALPLESNFSGVRYDQRLVTAVQSGSMRWANQSGGSDGDNSSRGNSGSSSSSGSSSQAGSSSSDCRHAQLLPAGRWRVLLDAAKGAATSPPDLSRFPADFVALSYYKAFGWPTGLGALLVRRDALPCLRRRYFGGGTVEVALADEPFHSLRPGPAGWEDGTPPFLDLPAVAAGFRFIERLGGFPAVAAHAAAVTSSLATQLAALRHWNGAPACTLYGTHAPLQQSQPQQRQGDAPQRPPQEQQARQQQQQPQPLEQPPQQQQPLPQEQRPPQEQQSQQQWTQPLEQPPQQQQPQPQEQPPQQQKPQPQEQQPQQQQSQPPPLPPGVAGQGPVVAFNLLRADGSFVGYREVERLASLHGVMLRTGCMCNPGACAAAVGLSAADMRANWEAGHVCWDGRDVIAGRPTGAVRASFGFASSLADAEAIAALVQRYFLEERRAVPAVPAAPAENALVAQHATPGGGTMPAAARAEAARHAAASPASAAHAAARPAAAAAAAGPAAAAAAAAPAAAAAAAARQRVGRVGALWVYPIKSCRGFSPPAWPLGPTGLLYDRCWALVDPDGSALRLKRHPALASIAARVDRKRRLLVVTAAGEEQALEVPLPEGGSADALPCCGRGSLCGSGGGGDECSGGSSGSPCSPSSCALPLASATQAAQPYSVRVCSRTAWVQRSAAATGGDVAAAAWFSRVLGTPCRLVQQAAQPSQTARSGGSAATSAEVEAGAGARADGSSSSGSGDGGGGITTSSGDSSGSGTSSGSSRSFANEGHLLVLGTASLADLASRAGSREPLQVFAQRFRPNLVIEGSAPYAEDCWHSMHLVATPEGGQPGGGTAGAHVAAAGAAVADSRAVQLASSGPCARCDVVCIHPLTGGRCGPEPLLTLSGYRRSRGRINFGQLMNVQEEQQQAKQCMQQSGGPAGLHPGGSGGTCTQCGGTRAAGEAAPAWVAVGDGVYVA